MQEAGLPIVNYMEANGNRHSIDVPMGENVMRGALYNGVEGIVGECGGGLSCATCHVYVDDAWTERVGGPSSEAEEQLLENASSHVLPSSRLGCQVLVTGELDGLVVHLPESQF